MGFFMLALASSEAPAQALSGPAAPSFDIAAAVAASDAESGAKPLGTRSYSIAPLAKVSAASPAPAARAPAPPRRRAGAPRGRPQAARHAQLFDRPARQGQRRLAGPGSQRPGRRPNPG